MKKSGIEAGNVLKINYSPDGLIELFQTHAHIYTHALSLKKTDFTKADNT